MDFERMPNGDNGCSPKIIQNLKLKETSKLEGKHIVELDWIPVRHCQKVFTENSEMLTISG